MSNMVHTSAGEKSTITPNSMQTAKPAQSAFDLGLESVAFPTPAVSEHLPGHSLSKFSVHYGSALPVQTKLTVGPVNDHYEREADHVAQRVVEQINNPIAQRQEMPEDEKDKPQTKAFNGAIQRQETPSDEEEPLQAKPFISSIQRQEMPEEEKDKLQTKSVSDAIQRQETPGDEDEPLQAKPLISTIQRQEMPEEEKDKLQTKSMSGVIQRQETPIDEEEPVQAKSLISAIQRQEAVQEDDEPLQAKPQIQRRSDGSTAATPQLERAIEQSRGSGHALPHSTRNSMEQAFGADFSGVRIHTDSRADQLNQSIQARAFTTSQDIYFRQGEHNPGTRAGQELLAHELTHVVQQSAQRSPSALSRANVLQRYFDQGYLTSTWRQADDLSMVVKQGYPNHEFYASAGKVAAANVKLAAVNSGVELIETSKEDIFWEGSHLKPTRQAKLKKVEAKNKQNKTQGNDMLLYADCGRSNAAVVGSEDRQAVYDKPGSAANTKATGSPDKMKIAIIKAWMEHEMTNNPLEKMAITRSLNAAALEELGLQLLEDKFALATTDKEKKVIKARYMKKLKEISDAYWAYYNNLSDTRRDQIDAELKINRYARPNVGQGYTTSSGGPSAGKDTWNFHWGGVVMASNDSNDNAVLENYAVGDPKVENKLWTFDMYGTQKKGQTFHERHAATQQHGTTPTTVTIEKK